jgi:hypothetical protein
MAETAKPRTVRTLPPATENAGYVLPLVHTHVPDAVVNTGFWAGLAGSAVLGVVDPPLAVLVGAGVLVARHRASH